MVHTNTHTNTVLFSTCWVLLHVGALLAFQVTLEQVVLYLVTCVAITNTMLTLLSSRDYPINKLRYILYAASCVLPFVFYLAYFVCLGLCGASPIQNHEQEVVFFAIEPECSTTI